MIIKSKIQSTYIHWNKESDIMYIWFSKTQNEKVQSLPLVGSV